MILYDMFVFSILLVIALRQAILIFRTGRPSSSGLLCLAIFIVYGLPLVYKYLLPNSFHSLGYIPAAMADPNNQFKYGIVILTGVALLKLTSIRGPAVRAQSFIWTMPDINWERFQMFTWLAWVIVLLPIIIVIFLVPNKTAYLMPGTLDIRGVYDPYARFLHNLLTRFVLLSLVGYLLIRAYSYFANGRLWTSPVVLATFLVCINAYLHGKRSIILASILTAGLFQLVEKGAKKFLLFGIPIALAFFFIYVSFGKSYETDFISFVRGDLARDHTLHFAIDQSHMTYNTIVPIRGNSFKWLATWYIPRRFLPWKDWPTSIYFTCAVFGRSIIDRLPWGFGVGYYEEFLMNFGYLGLLLFIPLGLLLRLLDKYIYERSSVYCIVWIPMLYNLMFASNAAIPLYMGIIIPVLIIFGLTINKQVGISADELEDLDYDEYGSVDAYY